MASRPPTEQQVVLDADGRPVMSALDAVIGKIGVIQKEVTEVMSIAKIGTKEFDRALAQTVKDLRNAMGQMKTLQSPGAGIQALNNDRGLARATVQATDYAKGLAHARDTAEALRGKINDLNREIAGRGASGQGATVAQRDRLALYERQLVALKALDAQQERNERRAARTGGGDLSAERRAVEEARARLQAAAMDPNKNGLTREIRSAQTAQDAFTEAVNRSRNATAALVREQRAQARDLTGREVRTMASGGQIGTVLPGLQMQRQLAEDRLAAATGSQIAPAREALAIAERRVTVAQRIAAEEKSTADWIARQNREAQALSHRQARALVPSQIAAMTDPQRGGVGPRTALVGLQMEQQLRAEALSNANGRIATEQALRSLELARLRVAEAQRIVNLEEREVTQLQSRNRLEEQAAARLSGRSRTEMARGEAAALRDINSIEAARVQQNLRLADARARLRGAAGAEARVILEEIQLEKAVGVELDRNLGKLRQLARERERQNRQTAGTGGGAGGGGGGNGDEEDHGFLGGMFGLPKGGIGTIVARTAAYAAAGAAIFGTISVIKEGVSFVLQLEDAMKRLQAISNSTDYTMRSLQGTIFNIGETSRYSILDLTEMATKLAQAGVSAGQMGDALSSVARLAASSGSTPQEAVDLVTSALGAFQLQVSESSRVADLMTTALNRTKLTVQQTGQAIQYVGATAYEQNITLEQLLATVGAVAQAGVKSGSTIGTGFRQFLVDLQSPSEKLTAVLAKFNLTAADVDVQTRGLPAVLETMSSAGLGAAQAYDALETRAAAFYLVAKNNVDVMDDLQIAFSQQGSSAVANERAMNSLTAQWQRFKNVLGEAFSQGSEGELGFWGKLTRAASDAIAKENEANRRIHEKEQEEILKNLAEYQAKLKQLMDVPVEQRQARTFFKNGWAFEVEDVKRQIVLATSLADSIEDYETRVARTGDTVQTTEDKINGLNKELARLYTQQESIAGIQSRVNAETASMTSRFEGLGKYLINTRMRFEDLTKAMQQLRTEEEGLLQSQLIEQRAAVADEKAAAGREAIDLQRKIAGNRTFMEALSPEGRRAVQNPGTIAGGIGAGSILLSEAKKFHDQGDVDAERELLRLAGLYGKVLGNAAVERVLETKTNMAEGRSTRAGSYIEGKLDVIPQQVAALGNMDPKLREAGSKAVMAVLDDVTHQAEFNLKNSKLSPALREYFTDVILRAKQARGEVEATVKGTVSEDRAAAKAEREAAAARRKQEADQRRLDRDEQTPLITRQDVIDVAKEVLGAGIVVGSGYRSPAAQDALHRRGVTRATGATSAHSNGIGQDFPLPHGTSEAEGERQAQALRRAYRARGMSTVVKYESGRGSNNGTGPHLHTGTPSGSRRAKGADKSGDDATFVADLKVDRIGVRNLDASLKDKLDDLKYATSEEVFNQGEKSARDALEAWKEKFTETTLNEAANQGMVGDALNERVAEMNATIAQRTKEVNDAIFDGILKNVQAQIKEAQTAFEEAIRPAAETLARARAEMGGLDYESLRGRVPDYVRELASHRASQANEALDRVRSSALPSEIDQLNASKSALIAKRDASILGGSWTAGQVEAANAQIKELTASIADLTAEKQNLDAALNSGGLVPTTLSEGLNQAIEAFKLGHQMTSSFREELIVNMGGALENAHEGLTTMFTDIMTGSKSVLAAFGDFVQGMIKYMIQLAAKAIATKIFTLLLNIGASAAGGGSGFGSMSGGQAMASGGAVPAGFGFGGFTGGGNVHGDGLMHLSRGGGRVANGSPLKDSVNAKIAKDEWVVNSRAVRSVGHDFMAKLNANGAAALDAMRASPVIAMPHQETNVWVVKPDTPRQMGKNDILVAVQEDIMQGGETKKLIKHVVNNG